MLVVEKYRCQREVGWSDEAEVHAGPPDATHGVPVVIKIRHGLPGPPRPDGRRDRFLRAANDQQAAVLAGCKSVAPVFEFGRPRGQQRVLRQPALPAFGRFADSGPGDAGTGGLAPADRPHPQALEDLRDKHARAHGNLKPTNIFLDGKGVASATVILSDLTIREEGTNQGTDCYGLGAVLYQLIRGRTVRNFDWPMVHGPDWEKLGPVADGWREFCNVLMSPETSANPDALGRRGRRSRTCAALLSPVGVLPRQATPPVGRGVVPPRPGKGYSPGSARRSWRE